MSKYRGVAQLASARGLGPRGRRFEPFHPDQIIIKVSGFHFNTSPLGVQYLYEPQ